MGTEKDMRVKGTKKLCMEIAGRVHHIDISGFISIFMATSEIFKYIVLLVTVMKMP